MGQSLDKSRMELARALAELDFSLKLLLDPVQYQQTSRRLSTLMKANSEYLTAFIEAKHKADGKVLLPKFMTSEMHDEMHKAGAGDPIKVWVAAKKAAGVE